MVEVKGKVVTPGLIDLHTHVFAGVNANGVDPNIGGVRAGVTTMVDAGSSGCDTFGGFPRHILPNTDTEIICFLHICRTGLATTPDIFSPSSIDLDNTVETINANKAHHLRREGADGVAGAGDHGDGDAPDGQAGGERGGGAADGAHRRHRETLRRQRHPRAAAHPGRGRHRHPLLHGQPRRGAG